MNKNIDPEKCKGCLDWLPNCEAECCKMFQIILNNVSEVPAGLTQISIKKPLIKDKIRYYELHGCKYDRRTCLLTIPLGNHKVEGNVVTIFRDCEALTPDLLCSLHGEDRQPSWCHHPSMLNYKDLPGVIITDRCLFKLKK